MADVAHGPVLPRPPFNLRGWRNRLVSSGGFQRWASGFVLTRGVARRDGQALFDIVSGFVYSQVLVALVELDVLAALRDAPLPPLALVARTGIAEQRLTALLQAGAALGLLVRLGDRFQTAQKGAALLGVPGLADMIRHHGAFYRDLADPVALLRGQVETELAGFWPYVFGATGAVPADIAARYSDLMAASQGLVAEETLRAVSLKNVVHLMDVGGGTGAFLVAVGAAYPAVKMTLFDLPQVVPDAKRRFARAGMGARVTLVPGSFREGALPPGADAISLVRVLYDHADETVAALLRAAYAALPPGGRILISEPMSGGAAPERSGDAYFAFYTMAMRTGRARSAQEIGAALAAAGFGSIATPATHRPFVTSVVTATKPR